MNSTTVREVLDERGKNYGSFQTFSNLSNALYTIILKHYSDIQNQNGNPKAMPAFMTEGLHMICHKLSRIANGDPNHIDSWVDIGGYAQLVADILVRIEDLATATQLASEMKKQVDARQVGAQLSGKEEE